MSFKGRPNGCSPRTPCLTQRLKVMRCFRMRGKKGTVHPDPLDPPRRRANKRRGRGTYANDRPPIVGVVGRNTGQVRVRVKPDTKPKPYVGTFMVVHKLAPSSIPTSRTVTSQSSGLTLPFAIARKNWH